MRRVRIVLLASAAVCVGLMIVISLLAATNRADRQRTTVAADTAPLATGSELMRPRRVPAVSLTDAAGHRVTLSRWRGKWIVLAPSLTLCQEVCPMTTGALMQLQSELRRAGLAHRVVVVEATVDPWRDDPARLRAYQRLTGARFAMLTGTRTEIRRLWSFFGVGYHRVPEGKPAQIDWMTHRPLTFDIEHTDGLFIVDPSGLERVADEGMPNVHDHLSAPLRRLLDAQGRHNLAHPELAWGADQVLSDLQHLMGLPASGDHAGSATVSAPTAGATARALRGSPAPLAELHHQADTLLGSTSALKARVRALRGYPIVINAWASWCTACRSEYGLMATAALRYGRRVAFLGADVNDTASAAASFMRAHPLSYPSYATSQQLGSLASLEGLPTTIFINRRGAVTDVHTGAYGAPGPLQDDIARFALGASTVSSS